MATAKNLSGRSLTGIPCPHTVSPGEMVPYAALWTLLNVSFMIGIAYLYKRKWELERVKEKEEVVEDCEKTPLLPCAKVNAAKNSDQRRQIDDVEEGWSLTPWKLMVIVRGILFGLCCIMVLVMFMTGFQYFLVA